MKVTVIHGSPRKGNTYHVAQTFINEMKTLGEVDVQEFFLPKDMPEFCKGCMSCIINGESTCPHAAYTQPIVSAMVDADALILTTPVYVLSASGMMKAFLDHLAYIFFVHRARPEMFHKKAFILSTTAGAGTKAAMKTIATSLKFWGVNRVYTKGFAMHCANWKDLSAKKKAKFECTTQQNARKFWKEVTSKKDHIPNLQTRFMFFVCKQMQKGFSDDSVDKQYWKEQGWFDGKSPFHS